jgi:hypothetical protein
VNKVSDGWFFDQGGFVSHELNIPRFRSKVKGANRTPKVRVTVPL